MTAVKTSSLLPLLALFTATMAGQACKQRDDGAVTKSMRAPVENSDRLHITWDEVRRGDVVDANLNPLTDDEMPEFYLWLQLCKPATPQEICQHLHYMAAVPTPVGPAGADPAVKVGATFRTDGEELNGLAGHFWNRAVNHEDFFKISLWEDDVKDDFHGEVRVKIGDVVADRTTAATVRRTDAAGRPPQAAVAVTRRMYAKTQEFRNPEGLKIEVVPRNRLPVAQLAKEATEFFAPRKHALPATVTVQKDFDGTEYGLRLLQGESELETYIRPGDVVVSYRPLTKDSSLKDVFEGGLWHGAIAVRNEEDPYRPGQLLFPGYPKGKICHVDGSFYFSGCEFDRHYHFFRFSHMTLAREREINELAARAHRHFEYDIDMLIDVAKGDLAAIRSGLVTRGELPTQYCSELPLTLHSLIAGQLALAPLPFELLVREFEDLVKTGKFNHASDPETIKSALLQALRQGYEFIGKELPAAKAMAVSFAMDTYLQNRRTMTVEQLVRNSVSRTAIAGFVAPRMPPHGYMTRAAEGGQGIHYVASLEDPSYPPPHRYVFVPYAERFEWDGKPRYRD